MRSLQQHGEFRCTTTAIYRITNEGCHARLDVITKDSPKTSSTNVASIQRASQEGTDPKLCRWTSATDKLKDTYYSIPPKHGNRGAVHLDPNRLPTLPRHKLRISDLDLDVSAAANPSLRFKGLGCSGDRGTVHSAG